jgi:hypothetical protein
MSIWDLVQQVQIENLKNRQISGESEAERAASRTRALGDEVHDRMERLVLVTEALWELLSERAGLTAADLAARVREIDARDGHEDGRRSAVTDAPQIRCPSCQAVVPAGKTKCQFCGAVVAEAKADPFRL